MLNSGQGPEWIQFDHERAAFEGAFPSARDLAIDHNGWAEDAIATRLDLFGMQRVQAGMTIRIAQHKFIKAGQQIECGSICLSARCLGGEPVALVIDCYFFKVCFCQFDTNPGVLTR